MAEGRTNNLNESNHGLARKLKNLLFGRSQEVSNKNDALLPPLLDKNIGALDTLMRNTLGDDYKTTANRYPYLEQLFNDASLPDELVNDILSTYYFNDLEKTDSQDIAQSKRFLQSLKSLLNVLHTNATKTEQFANCDIIISYLSNKLSQYQKQINNLYTDHGDWSVPNINITQKNEFLGVISTIIEILSANTEYQRPQNLINQLAKLRSTLSAGYSV